MLSVLDAGEKRGLTDGRLIDIMRTNVRVWCEQGERKERRMAFSCVMYWKEECDGCEGCMEEVWKRLWEERV